jgi:energy-coupling factor transport system permease protein
MSLIFDLYVPGRSWLHRLDPRVKLGATLLGILTTFLLPGPLSEAVFLLGVILTLRSVGVTGEKLRWLWRQMRMLVILILLLQPFFTPAGSALISMGPLQLTWGGIYHAVHLALRALNMSFITGVLLFTTEQRALVRAFVRLGLPYTWGLTLSLTLRFLPALHDLFTTVREAQASRGWVVEGNPLQRARDYLPVLVAVVIGTLRMGDQLTLALAARGLGTTGRRTTWHDLNMRPTDWAILSGIALSFGLFLLWRFAWL